MYTKFRALFLLACVICASCSDNLRPEPISNRSLSGTWRVAAVQRDAVVSQLHAALNAAIAKQLDRDRKRSARSRAITESEAMDEHVRSNADAMDASMEGNGPGGHYRWELRELREQRAALLATLQPATEMKIEQIAGRINITSADAAKRSFEPGVSSTLVTTFARLYIQSGWQNDEFVVHSKDRKTDIDQVERYHRLPDGSLLLSVTLDANDMQTQRYSLVYQFSVVP